MIDGAGAAHHRSHRQSRLAPLLRESELAADTRHFLDVAAAARAAGPASHVRLNIFPDGGISRLRVWGQHDD